MSTQPQAKLSVSRNVVFIVGAPRSGTSWLNWMLTSHPSIVGGPESNFFTLGFAELLKKYERSRKNNWPHSGLHHYLNPEDLQTSILQFWDTVFSRHISEKPEASILIEKTPKHGSYIPEILRLFPNAKFIHCLRNSEDCVASHLRATQTWSQDIGPKSTIKAAKLWKRRVSEINHAFSKLPEGNCIVTRYENLKENTEFELKEIFNWLGVEADKNSIHQISEAHTLDKTAERLNQKNFNEFIGNDGIQKKTRLNPIQRLIVRRITAKLG
jgi:LPS sulfotransferase NodH